MIGAIFIAFSPMILIIDLILGEGVFIGCIAFPRISGCTPARVNSVKEKFRRKGSYIDELLKYWR